MKSSVRIGPVFLTMVFLVAAGGAYSLRGLWRAERAPRMIVMPAQSVTLEKPLVPDAPPLEHAPGPPVATPELPEDTADKAELWHYGETYLGWGAVDNVDLDDYSATELRTWLKQDQKLYDWGDGLAYDELGYLETGE